VWLDPPTVVEAVRRAWLEAGVAAAGGDDGEEEEEEEEEEEVGDAGVVGEREEL
jgi:hypothetical protein